MRIHDVIIVGGGLVGLSLACALRKTALTLALIEATPFPSGQPDSDTTPGQDSAPAVSGPACDDRGLALSLATRRVLDGLGLWAALAPEAVAILGIHVSEQGRFGAVHLRAEECALPALAHVLPAATLRAVLTRAVKEPAHCDVYSPATITAVHCAADVIEVTVQDGGTIRSLRGRLLVVADGAHSPTREMLGVTVRVRDYKQVAIVASVQPSRAHQNIAYERFTPTGPIALLPQSGGRCGLVCVVPAQEAEAAMAASDAHFLAQVQARFGQRLGVFTAPGRRSRYALRLCVAGHVAGGRHVVIGNAAHTVHPNAAQGFNLGMRDVALLAELLHDAAHRGEDAGAAALTETYAQRAQTDLRRTVRFADGLARVFYNDWLALSVLRQAGMLAMELLPPLKRALVRTGSGLRGRVPRLVQGLPL